MKTSCLSPFSWRSLWFVLVLSASPIVAGDYYQKFSYPDGTENLGDGSYFAADLRFFPKVVNESLLLTEAGIPVSSFYGLPLLGDEAVGGVSVGFDYSLDLERRNPSGAFTVSFGEIQGSNFYDPEISPDDWSEIVTTDDGLEVAPYRGIARSGLTLAFDFEDTRVKFSDDFEIIDPAGIEVWHSGRFIAGIDIDENENNSDNQLFRFDGSRRRLDLQWQPEGEGGVLTVINNGKRIFDRLPVPYQVEPDHRTAFYFQTYQGVTMDNLAVVGTPDRDPISGLELQNAFEVEAGTIGATEILVHNHGREEELQITEASFEGLDAEAFRLISTLPLKIPPGEALPVRVEAESPETFGTLEADLILTTNEIPLPDVTRRIGLEGILVPPANQPIQYEQNFDGFADGTTALGDGSIINATRKAVAETQGGVLKLSDSRFTETRSSYIIPPLGIGTRGSFRAVFDVSIDAELPGLGFSFNFGTFADDAVGGRAALKRYLAIDFNTAGINNFGIEWRDIEGQSIDLSWYNSPSSRFFSPDPEVPLFPLGLEPTECEVVWRRLGPLESSLSLRWGNRWIFEDVVLSGLPPDPQWRLAFGAENGEENGNSSLTESVILDNLRVQSPAGDSFGVPGLPDPQIETERRLFFATERDSPATRSLVIRNEGRLEDLVVTGAQLTGGAADAFSILTPFPLTVAPGEQNAVDLNFSGTADLGTFEATLIVENNDARVSRQSRRIDLVGVVSPAGGIYDQNFTDFPDGTTQLFDGSIMSGLQGLPEVAEGQLRLSRLGITGVLSSFRTPPLGDAAASTGLFASFDYAVVDLEELFSGGFAFNVGDFSKPTFPNGRGARGMGSGLAIEFEPSSPVKEGLLLGPGLNVSYNGEVIAQNLLPEGADVLNSRFFESTAAGDPLKFKRVEVYLRYGENEKATLDVFLDGEPVFQKVEIEDLDPTPAIQCGFSASGSGQAWLIDHLNVQPATNDPTLFLHKEQDFGFARNSDPVRDITVFYRNPGQETLEIAEMSVIEGGDVFRVVDFPPTLAPGASGTFVLEADPAQAFGLTTGLLRIISNDLQQPIRDVPLRLSAPLSPDLLAHYPMDETDGWIMVDRSGNGFHGVYDFLGAGLVELNQPGLAAGKAVRLGDDETGGTGFARVDGFPALDSFTISMWLQLDPDDRGDGATFFSKGRDSEFRFALASLKGTGLTSLIVQESPEEPEFSEPVISGLDPSHLVLSFDHETLTSTLSINGKTVVDFKGTSGFQDPGDPLFLGAFASEPSANGFSGLLDDVQVYNRVLDSADVEFLFEHPGMTLAAKRETSVTLPSRVIVAGNPGSVEPFFLTIENPDADGPLQLTGAELTRQDRGAFSILTSFPVTIEPGGESRLEFAYEAGMALGEATARLVLTHDVAGVAEIPPVALRGYTVPPGNRYFQDFDDLPDGTTTLPDGAVIGSETETATVSVQNGSLTLAGSEEVFRVSSIKTPVLGSAPNEGFIATFDYALSANPDRPPGMGFSFNYGPIPDGSDFGEGDLGFGRGLSVGFDTFDKFSLAVVDLTSDGLGVDVRIDDRIVKSDKNFDVDPFANRFFTIRPYREIPVFRQAKIIWLKEAGNKGVLTVMLDRKIIMNNVRTLNFNPTADCRFAISAREGVGSQSILIDNLGITAITVPFPASTSERLTIARQESVSLLSWISEARRSYEIQFSPNLFDWAPIGQIEGSGGVKAFVDLKPDRSFLSEGYYRTLLKP